MNRFKRQLMIGSLLLLLGSVLVMMAHRRFSQSLPHYAYLTGWVLFGFMILLTVYNARKKLPFLPLATSEGWLQIHIYAGFFTVILFLVHVNFRMPTGYFEGTLAWLYFLVAGSGVLGLVLSRILPRRLATYGGEVLFERIPALRHNFRQKAEAIALGRETKSPALAEFYVRHLNHYFAGARNYWHHLIGSRLPLNVLMTELEDLRRYLNQQESASLDQLAQIIRQKEGLDYHYSLQLTLKLWLFAHLPLTYGLMIFSLLHIFLVFAFSGGAR